MQNREEIDIVDDRNEESDNSDKKDSDDEDIISKNLDKSSTSEEFDPYEETPLAVTTIYKAGVLDLGNLHLQCT